MTRIAIVGLGDPTNPTTWSGTPAGIIRSLSALGVDVVPINAIPAPAWGWHARRNAAVPRYLRPGKLAAAARRARAAAIADPMMSAAQSRAANNALSRAGTLDGVIQLGSDFQLDTHVPLISFEDMTVAQMSRHPYPGWELLSTASVDRRIDAQRQLYERADACCLATPWAAQSVIDDYGIPADRVHVIGLGSNRRKSVGPPRDWSTPKFLFVGSHWERKNGARVLAAFCALRERCPGARLDVVGAHPPICQPGVVAHGSLRLDVPEERRRLDELFASATCFLMPSRIEAAGIAFIEAAKAGIPSIGPTTGGGGFFIGEGGTTVDPEDSTELLEAMAWLADPAEARHAGALAHERSELFSWKLSAERLLRALQGELPVPVSQEFGMAAAAPSTVSG